MKRKDQRWIAAAVIAGAVIGGVAGCGKEATDESANAPSAKPVTMPAGLAAATRTSTTSKPKDDFATISSDEPVPFETPEGKNFKIKKNGLAFRVDNEGSGNPPKPGENVEVKFTLMHMDKKEIQSNQKDPKAAPFRFTFGTKDELAFWNEAVAGMKRGGKRRLIVPPSLAFGDKGFKDASGQQRVAPGETLLVDIELVNVFSEAPPEPMDDTSGPPKFATTAPADLKIEEIQVGTGEEAIAGKKLKVKYVGKLTNGETFDQGIFDFVIGYGNAITGWHNGIGGMKVGGKRKLTIPPRLAYGEQGQQKIPPNSTLIFDVELLEVK